LTVDRKLIYVPIIHTSEDMGSLADNLTKIGIDKFGRNFWKQREKTVERYWEVISEYFDSIDVAGFKVYQDGMVADGEMGKKIVKEGKKSGSRNFQLLSRLLDRGAILVKTEDVKLAKKERDRLLNIIRAKSKMAKGVALIKSKLQKNKLLEMRDRFIARRIKETLAHNETGIIFIGAYHEIREKLPEDITVRELKDREKVKEYHKLLPLYKKRKKRFEELTQYLTSEINLNSEKQPLKQPKS